MQPSHLSVVSSNDPAPAFTEDYTYEEWAEDLRGVLLNTWHKTGCSIEDIAAKAFLGASTVERFMLGKTKRPQMRTTFEISRVMGFKMPLASKMKRQH